MTSQSPFQSIPLAVVALAVLICGIEVVFQLANAGILGGPRGVGWRAQAIEDFAFSPVVFDRVLSGQDASAPMLRRFVTYPFVNGDWVQVAFCAALTLALGKFVCAHYGSARMVVVFFGTTIAGALAFGLLVDGRMALFGGYTPVYGLIGAYTYALWFSLRQAGENQLIAFRLIGVLLAIQLLFGLIFGASSQWIAELTGFCAGFGMATILAPGGWAALLHRLRQRD